MYIGKRFKSGAAAYSAYPSIKAFNARKSDSSFIKPGDSFIVFKSKSDIGVGNWKNYTWDGSKLVKDAAADKSLQEELRKRKMLMGFTLK
jgi:hypothetical protein